MTFTDSANATKQRWQRSTSGSTGFAGGAAAVPRARNAVPAGGRKNARRHLEPCGHLTQALVSRMRIKPAVELLMDEVRDIMQIRVD
jgi:hypothetical protein